MSDIQITSRAIERISTSVQINRASDNAAGLAITEGMNSQIKSAQVNVNNISDMGNLVNTAESSLGSIHDSLGRIRELAVQSGSGIMTQSDKENIQLEIESLKEGISSVVGNTEFNTIKLLDGSFNNKKVAMNTNGTGSSIYIANTSLETLGIKNFDITGDFSMEDIDEAMEKISNSRSKLGSVSNAFEHSRNNITNGMQNISSSMSKIKDTDIIMEISKLKKQEVLQEYAMFAKIQKNQQLELNAGVNANFYI